MPPATSRRYHQHLAQICTDAVHDGLGSPFSAVPANVPKVRVGNAVQWPPWPRSGARAVASRRRRPGRAPCSRGRLRRWSGAVGQRIVDRSSTRSCLGFGC